MTEIERFNKALIAATDRLELEGHSDCSNELFLASNAILTTIESLQEKIDVIKTAKERLLRYTHQCRKERDGWQSRAIRAEQQAFRQSALIESQKEALKGSADISHIAGSKIKELESTVKSQKEEINKQCNSLNDQLLFVQSLHQQTQDNITKEQCRIAMIRLQEEISK